MEQIHVLINRHACNAATQVTQLISQPELLQPQRQHIQHTTAPLPECLPESSSIPSPLSELGIEETVGESLAADSDALQHSIAPQLMQHQVSVYHAWSLQFIGNDATHKVGCCVAWGQKTHGLTLKKDDIHVHVY